MQNSNETYNEAEQYTPGNKWNGTRQANSVKKDFAIFIISFENDWNGKMAKTPHWRTIFSKTQLIGLP